MASFHMPVVHTLANPVPALRPAPSFRQHEAIKASSFLTLPHNRTESLVSLRDDKFVGAVKLNPDLPIYADNIDMVDEPLVLLSAAVSPRFGSIDFDSAAEDIDILV
jgi:hypothetical protein